VQAVNDGRLDTLCDQPKWFDEPRFVPITFIATAKKRMATQISTLR
jgi:hypothetical protein